MRDNLLIEIGTEELPPKALLTLSQTFGSEIEKGLAAAKLQFESIATFATPRRLAVCVDGLETKQEDRREVRKGPAINNAFDDAGEPTKAALGFARSCGTDVQSLSRISGSKGEQWLAYEMDIPGRGVSELIAPIIEQAVHKLPIPKRMRWGSGEVEFVRPVHWAVVLFGSEPITCQVLGLNAGAATRGHRFHSSGAIDVPHASDYANVLESSGRVIASFEARRHLIASAIAKTAEKEEMAAVISDALLDEVTALVEWPVAVSGQFDEKFLSLPEEALIASMQDHQKYFPLRDAQGRLTNRFITISNIESTRPELVRQGNERVIRPRLADADFFFTTDREQSLASRCDNLARVTFERRLGSLLDKTQRIQNFAHQHAPAFGADQENSVRAAMLSRCDLLTDMVGEFPELQGTMGSYYAAHDGEPDAVVAALREFYTPRFSGDEIAATAAGQCIAVGDRLDTLIGIFGIGGAPTGDKDPYALRRAALGVLRTLIEGEIELDLWAALTASYEQYSAKELEKDAVRNVFQFMQERLRGYCSERGFAPHQIAAVITAQPKSPLQTMRRIEAVAAFEAMEEAESLAGANKRIGNILKKQSGQTFQQWEQKLLTEPAEIALAERIRALEPIAAAHFEAERYTEYLAALAELRVPIDKFFDDVMVMAEDADTRANRIALLASIQNMFKKVADIAELKP
ncbi:MAG: glycine--tRNA ligase subunit beta [Gammaproteobacteria bacterium]